jgi:VCBS repeat-containing protein
VAVVSTAVGAHVNHTGSVPSTNANAGPDATATLTVTNGGPSADLTLTKSHIGNFSQGQGGATYTLSAQNVGAADTSGTVTVSDTLPASLTATGISGSGWTCTLATLTCTRSNPLAAQASYPVITLAVNVAANAPASVVNTATVSGGGEINTANDTATDPTTIAASGGGNHAPFAVNDALQVAPGGTATTTIGNASSLLANDSDLEGDVLSAELVSNPGHGTVSLNADGTFSYQHSGDQATSDTFTYRACDSQTCDGATVAIAIGNGLPNRLPVVVDDALQVAPNGVTSALIGDLLMPNSVLHNDSDPDGGGLSADKVSPLLTASGTLTVNGDGTFTYQNTDPSATADEFLYAACDANGGCAPGIVSITISSDPQIDLLPIAMDDEIVVGPLGSASTLVGGASSVLANDSDPDPGETATLTAHLIAAPLNGHVTLNTTGTFVYTNDDVGTGADSFQYEACDDDGACVAATVSVTIDSSAPTVVCVLPRQVDVVGDFVSLDLSALFAAPPGHTLDYSGTNLPASLSIIGSLLTGTLQATDVPGSPYASTLKAATAPGGVSASENVVFEVLPVGEILWRDGFDGASSPQPCQ